MFGSGGSALLGFSGMALPTARIAASAGEAVVCVGGGRRIFEIFSCHFSSRKWIVTHDGANRTGIKDDKVNRIKKNTFAIISYLVFQNGRAAFGSGCDGNHTRLRQQCRPL